MKWYNLFIDDFMKRLQIETMQRYDNSEDRSNWLLMRLGWFNRITKSIECSNAEARSLDVEIGSRGHPFLWRGEVTVNVQQ